MTARVGADSVAILISPIEDRIFVLIVEIQQVASVGHVKIYEIGMFIVDQARILQGLVPIAVQEIFNARILQVETVGSLQGIANMVVGAGFSFFKAPSPVDIPSILSHGFPALMKRARRESREDFTEN
jgi:hypothetical protein